MLSDRNNIIVMADEAHRTQYDALALNLRTGTPLITGEERTHEVLSGISLDNRRVIIMDF